jgi:hypothetical protein
MKAIRTLFRTEEVEVERQITVKEVENQEKKFIVVELNEDDIAMITHLCQVSLREDGSVISFQPSHWHMRSWPGFVKKVKKAWDK